MSKKKSKGRAVKRVRAPEGLSIAKVGKGYVLPVLGLPRSGSTLLINLLAQNPIFTVGPTSGLADLFAAISEAWRGIVYFQAEGLEKVHPKIKGSLYGAVWGHYRQALDEGKIVLEKSRNWIFCHSGLEEVLETEVPVIATIRDVREIAASFERTHQKGGFAQAAFKQFHTVEQRMDAWLGPKGMVGAPAAKLVDVVRETHQLGDRYKLISMGRLLADPIGMAQSIYDMIGLDVDASEIHDPSKVEQVTYEDDCVHGWDPNSLHSVRPEVEAPEDKRSWEDVISEDLADKILNEFEDLCKVCVEGKAPSILSGTRKKRRGKGKGKDSSGDLFGKML